MATTSEPDVPEVAPADPAQTDEGTGAAGPEAAEDEVKRRFREALDRKRAQQADANAAHRARGSATIGSTHGPAQSRRSFRRKSG